jgi:aurora kinase, other
LSLFRHIKSGFVCALKRIDKDDIDHKLVIQLIREIKIQSYLHNPNIVKLYTFFCDQRYIYLVMELCLSGQLYGFLKKKRKLNEDLTKVILKDTLKALDYMHER